MSDVSSVEIGDSNCIPFKELSDPQKIWALLLAEVGPSDVKGSTMSIETAVKILNQNKESDLSEDDISRIEEEYLKLRDKIDKETKGLTYKEDVIQEIVAKKTKELGLTVDSEEISGLIADYYLSLISN